MMSFSEQVPIGKKKIKEYGIYMHGSHNPFAPGAPGLGPVAQYRHGGFHRRFNKRI